MNIHNSSFSALVANKKRSQVPGYTVPLKTFVLPIPIPPKENSSYYATSNVPRNSLFPMSKAK